MIATPVAPNCPFCGAPLAADQIWCFECGAPARTRLAPTPRRWRLIAGVLLIASALAIVAIAVAVAKLARSDAGPPPVTTIVSSAPVPATTAPVTSVPAGVTTAPVTGLPPAATTATVTSVPAPSVPAPVTAQTTTAGQPTVPAGH